MRLPVSRDQVRELPPDAQRLRRFVNEQIRERAERLQSDPSTTFEFVCECGDLRCRQSVRMTLCRYDRSRLGSVLGHF